MSQDDKMKAQFLLAKAGKQRKGGNTKGNTEKKLIKLREAVETKKDKWQYLGQIKVSSTSNFNIVTA